MRQDVEVSRAAGGVKLDPENWVDAHGDALYRFALLRVRDRQAAEELVQETFVAALGGLDKFAGAASERTWLTGILKYKVIDHFRRKGREGPGGVEEVEGAGFEGLFSKNGHWKRAPGKWAVDAGELLEREEFWGVLEDCLRGLPERAGRAFILRVLDEGEAEMVCQAMGITPTNLWALLCRARERLRGCLEAKWFMNERERR